MEHAGLPALTAYPYPNAPSSESGTTVAPVQLFSVLWRRKAFVVLVGTALSGLAIYGIGSMSRSYVASASVLIQERKSIVSDVQTNGTVATDSVAVRTQADILRSTDLARGVVRKLGLADMPEFVAAFQPGPVARLLNQAQQRDPSGRLQRLAWFDLPPAPTAQEREDVAVLSLLGLISIVNDGRSYVIDIKAKVPAIGDTTAQHTARLSATIVNAYAEAYSQFTSTVKSDTIKRVNGFFDERLAALQEKVRRADHAVQNYRLANNLLEDRAAGGDGRLVTVTSQQLAQTNADLVAASADRAVKEASYEQVNLARNGRGDLQTVVEVVSSPLIQQLRAQQAQIGAKAAALATTRGSGSPDLAAAQSSLRDISAQIGGETAKIAASLRNGVETARAREATLRTHLALLQADVGREGQKEIQLRELQSNADIARGIYGAYLKRSVETSEVVDIQEPDALVVSSASVPLAAAPPSPKQLGALAVLTSFFAAGVLALVRERLQGGFRTAQQLQASIGLETLGYVPRVSDVTEALSFKDRFSPFSEAIVSIRTLLRMTMRDTSQVVLITSAQAREGKTMLATSLARNAAMAGERVLLVDCDLRRPAVLRNFTMLEGHVVDDVTIRRDNHSSLDIIRLSSDGRNPPDFFASPHMRNLLSMLRKRYDLIVLDAPPVLAVSDARVLCGLADQTVVVVEWQKTPQPLVMQAIHALRSSGATVAGTVISQVRLRSLSVADGRQSYLQYRGNQTSSEHA